MVIRNYLFLVLLSSCSAGQRLPAGGLRPLDYQNRDYGRFIDDIYQKNVPDLDTESVYVSIGMVKAMKENIKIYPENKIKGVYRFYENGKCSFFSIKFDSISKNDFNPKSGNMCFYKYDKNRDVLKSYIFMRTPSGARFYERKLFIKGDTIFEEIKELRSFFEVYVKRNVPNDWLLWNPDW